MIRHLRVRTKMLVMLAAPLIALLVFAGLSITTRLDALAEARTAQALTELTQRIEVLLTALQEERHATATMIAEEAGIDSGALADRWQATDAATDMLLPEGLDLQDPEVTEEVETALAALDGQLQRLPAGRDAVERGLHTRETAEDFYSRLINEAIDVQRIIGGAVASSEVGNDLATLTGISVLIEASAREQILVGRAIAGGVFLGAEQFQYVAQVRIAETTEADMLASMRPEHHDIWRQTLSGPAVAEITTIRRQATVSPTDTPPAMTLESFTETSEAYRGMLQAASATVADDIVNRAGAAAESARNDAVQAGIVAGGVVAIALLLSALVTRQTVEPLSRLTQLAHDVSSQQLPMLVDSLRRGGAETTATRVQPIQMDSKDEIGRLAKAFDEIHAVAVRTATDLSELTRKGISDLFVNLARRNQSLLDRQIGVLDRLEQDEADPEALERLFTLDHLATRMRRNAESLLVLAGAETPRRWTQPVALEELVRAAMGEVEAYARIQVTGIQPRMVSGRAAADLAHLLAELLENATVYSPPVSPVTVTTRTSEDGLVVSIRDRGLGMSAESIAEANYILGNPPTAGFGLSRSLGFIVAGLLARRHGARVRLEGAEEGGTIAEVLIPGVLLTTEGSGELPEIDQKDATTLTLPDGEESGDQVAGPAQPSQPAGLPSGRRRQQPRVEAQESSSWSTAPTTASAGGEDARPRHAAPGPEVEQPADAPRHAAPAADPASAHAALGGLEAPPSMPSPPATGASPAVVPTGPAETGHGTGGWSGDGGRSHQDDPTNRSLREILPRRRGNPQGGGPGQGGSWSLPSRGAPQAPAGPPASSGGGTGWTTPSPGSVPDAGPGGEPKEGGSLPRRAPGASGRRNEVQAARPLANEPDVEAQTDTSDILTRYLTGISRKRSDEAGDAVDPPPTGGEPESSDPQPPSGRGR